MGGFPLLDVVIGLVFVYLLLALICSALTEWIAQWSANRGKVLQQGIKKLLGEEALLTPKLTNAFYQHPLVKALSGGTRPPSYIPSRVFAAAVKDLIESDREDTKAPDELDVALRSLQGVNAGRLVGSVPTIDTALAELFDSGMERLAGVYKRKTRVAVFWISAVLAIAANANTLTLATNLWNNADLRAYVVERAKVRLEQGAPLETVEYTNPDNPEPSAPVDSATAKSPDRLLSEEKELLGRLIGWRGVGNDVSELRVRHGPQLGTLFWAGNSLAGWLITALAVSLGAPFWFEILNKLIKFRSTGAVPAKASETTAGIKV